MKEFGDICRKKLADKIAITLYVGKTQTKDILPNAVVFSIRVQLSEAESKGLFVFQKPIDVIFERSAFCKDVRVQFSASDGSILMDKPMQSSGICWGRTEVSIGEHTVVQDIELKLPETYL